MPISTIKDIDKLLVLLQKRGVKSFKLGNLEVTLGDIPTPQPKRNQVPATDMRIFGPQGTNVAASEIETEELTGDALLFYSADASN